MGRRVGFIGAPRGRSRTMNAPGVELGRLGVEALIDRLEARTEALPQILLPCSLNVAESTSVAPSRSVSAQQKDMH